MTGYIVAVTALLAVLALQWVVLLTQQRSHGRERDAWMRERYELNQRIQAPQIAPFLREPLPSERPAEPLPTQDQEPDESHDVGTVVI